MGQTLIRKHLNQLVSLIYPSVCVACEVPLNGDAEHVEQDFRSDWCDDCWLRLPESWQQGCPKCGSFVQRPLELDDRCALCRDYKLKFTSVVALGNYQGMLKRLVLDLKRDMNEQLTYQLGRLLGLRLMQQDFFDSADFLLPVPIHMIPRFVRGFYAAGVIAEGVSATTGLPVQSRLLRCKRRTQKQGKLQGAKRFENVKDAFALRPLVNVEGSRIVIIDDVMTSGATISELSHLLLKSGAADVNGAIVARATGSYRFSVE